MHTGERVEEFLSLLVGVVSIATAGRAAEESQLAPNARLLCARFHAQPPFSQGS